MNYPNFRIFLPGPLTKVISAVVTAFLLLDIGASNFYSTIIIPALTGLNAKNNPDETLQMTAAEVSWFGTCAPNGSTGGDNYAIVM